MLAFIRKSVARKVALLVGLSALVVTAIGLTGMMILFRSDVRSHARTSIELLGETVGAAFASFDQETGRHPVPALVSELANEVELARLRVFDRRGRITWSQDTSELGRTLTDPLLERFHSGRRSLRRTSGDTLSLVRPVRARGRCLSCHDQPPTPTRGDPLGGIHLEISHAELTSRLSAYAHLQITTALLLVAFIGLITVLALRAFVSNPLQKLSRAIEAAEEGDFLHRVDVTARDEVGRLADDFNRMLARLTAVQASKIDSEMELDQAQRELQLKEALEEKNRIIEETNRKLTKRLNELGLLFDTTRALTSTLELDGVLEAINELIGVTLQYHKFSILLMDERRERLVVKYVYGAEHESTRRGALIDPHRGLIGQVIRSGRRVLVSDLSRFTDRDGPIERSLPPEGSFLCIPMVHKDTLLGVLNFTRPDPDGFAEDEIRLLNSLARQAGMAVMNAQLYQEKLELSVTDELTQVANRRQLQTRLELEWNRARRFGSPLSALMVDIDFFKRYNDVNGHLLGDQVLQGVARTLENNTRKVDTVARFGGEEFVVLLPGQDKATAVEIAEKLRRAVARQRFPRMSSQPHGHLSITVGAATHPQDADDPNELLDLADLALYMAKRAGRDQVRAYERGMQQAEQERRAAKTKRSGKRRRRRRRPSGQQRPRIRHRSSGHKG
jgi:diguanylate cyclase (GGDEF)-like protein